MEFDDETLKQLIATFKVELEEQSQLMIEALLKLEKNTQHDKEYSEAIITVFRAAHNIKGAARGIGIHDLGEIAHHIESLFASIQKDNSTLSSPTIDLCLESVDSMKLALQLFIEKKEDSHQFQDLLSRLKNGAATDGVEQKPKVNHKPHDDQRNTNHINEHESIRVALSNLDRVSFLTEEMQVNKIAMDDHYSEINQLLGRSKQFLDEWKKMLVFVQNVPEDNNKSLSKVYALSKEFLTEINYAVQQIQKNMRPHMNELSSVLNSLQDEVRMLRLIPITTYLRTLPRSMRALAHDLHKDVEIEIRGEEVKIDKMVLEGLQDPIMHILRNAIDHGIEAPETRIKQGKPEIGHIVITVKEEGNQVLMDISDDGAGIDVNHIADVAKKRNLVNADEIKNMSEEAILNLIFRSGFSTNEIITDVSGRGVGLDVVKNNLSNLKGNITISTALNKGTTFHLQLPLTLASERGLMVTSGGQPFIIPGSDIERILTLNSNAIIDIEASQAISLNNRTIPLFTLADILDLKKMTLSKQNEFAIIVIRRELQTIALVVDEVIGEREIVIKSMQAPLTKIPCVTGGTLSGKGQVIIVLNSLDVIARAFSKGKASRITLENEVVSAKRPHILVVDDSITTRTLEKNILENKGYDVTVAVNGKEAWDLLQKQKFSLLLTDIMMPVMDGFTLTEQVKQHATLRELPVIIVTSLDSDDEKQRGIEVGADAYIVKSEFESGALLAIVEQLV